MGETINQILPKSNSGEDINKLRMDVFKENSTKEMVSVQTDSKSTTK